MSRILVSVCFWFVMVRSIRSEYQNDFDKPLDFKCHSETMNIPSDVTHILYKKIIQDGLLKKRSSCRQQISRIFSEYNDDYEDRRFGFECRELPIKGRGAPQCTETGYVNDFDEGVAYTCPENGYITGMASVHNEDAEDRRWRYRCCVRRGIRLYNCETSDWTNEYEGRQEFNVPSNKVLHGAFSVHSDDYVDRRFKYSLCDIGKY